MNPAFNLKISHIMFVLDIYGSLTGPSQRQELTLTVTLDSRRQLLIAPTLVSHRAQELSM